MCSAASEGARSPRDLGAAGAVFNFMKSTIRFKSYGITTIVLIITHFIL